MRSTTICAAAWPALVLSTSVPCLEVPACPGKGTITYDKSVPDKAEFPLTQVDLCYDKTAIVAAFTAYDEVNFYFDPAHGTNDELWRYEVMEAFIARGTNDPKTYLEFEISPNNKTFNAFIYNPSKVRDPAFPLDTFFIQTPIQDGLVASTALDKGAKKWTSTARIPLGLFNVDEGKAEGTEWRMNFFRTVVSPKTYPDQGLGAWNPPDEASFHKTPFFGKVNFI